MHLCNNCSRNCARKCGLCLALQHRPHRYHQQSTSTASTAFNGTGTDLDLLMGENIYDDPYAFVRELVQNFDRYDSCH